MSYQASLIGCPGEENSGGKTYLIRYGVFSDICAAVLAHPWNICTTFVPGFIANIRQILTEYMLCIFQLYTLIYT